MTRRMNNPDETGADGGGAHDWPALIGRLADSVTRIASAEILLLENRLRLELASAIHSAVARMAALAVLMAAGLLGLMCLLCGYIFLLHQRLPWWQAFAIGGVTIIIIGLIVFAALNTIAHMRE